MKKFLFILMMVSLAPHLQSQESWLSPELEEKKPFRLRNRTFELGIANVDIGVANNLISAFDIFQPTLVIDHRDLERGFNLSFDANIRPLFFNINIRDRWGFGLDIANITAYGNVDISGDLLHFRRAENEKFGVGAAVFAELGIPIFFHIGALRIDFRPAGFVPIAYTVPNMRYSFRDINQGALLEIDLAARLYTPLRVNFRNFDLSNSLNNISSNDVFSFLGVDFSLGAEYPLFRKLDLGLNITNIPLVTSTMRHFVEVNERITVDTSYLDLQTLLNGGDLPEEFLSIPGEITETYGEDELVILRPFKMVFYANYRPFNSPVLSLIPSIGFSVNSLFVDRVSVEGGLRVRLDLANMFIATIGAAYEDQMWRNSVNLIFNFRLIELGLGVSMQSQQFVRSWQGAGLRVAAAVKMGW